jgi:hypothetical protein
MAARATAVETRPAGVGDKNVKIRYTINSMMGDDNVGTDIRPDNVQGIADQVNARLSHPREGSFSPRRANS